MGRLLSNLIAKYRLLVIFIFSPNFSFDPQRSTVSQIYTQTVRADADVGGELYVEHVHLVSDGTSLACHMRLHQNTTGSHMGYRNHSCAPSFVSRQENGTRYSHV
jgi:hypothetical protein